MHVHSLEKYSLVHGTIIIIYNYTTLPYHVDCSGLYSQASSMQLKFLLHAQGKQRVATVSVLATNNVRIRYGHGLTAGSVSGTKRTPCTYVMGHYNTAPARSSPSCSVEIPTTQTAYSPCFFLTPSLSIAADPVFSRVYSPVTTLNGVMRTTYSKSHTNTRERALLLGPNAQKHANHYFSMPI